MVETASPKPAQTNVDGLRGVLAWEFDLPPGETKAVSLTPLDDIPGIGATRKRALLQHFGSAKAVARAGLSDLQAVDGISEAMAKTIADCFKFRNKIGLDVALEALKEAWRAKRVTMDELWHFGQICRVQNVMRPYLEGLTA